MEHTKLRHMGVVMNSQERVDRSMRKFGLEKDYMEYMESYKSSCLFTKHKKDEMPIELVIPLGGILAIYNNGRGGMHHIVFEVGDAEEIKRKYRVEGMRLLGESAVPGAGRIIVDFPRPRFGGGILMESVRRLKK